MKFNNVYAAYFSATGTTEKVVTELSQNIAKLINSEVQTYDFTLPENRNNPPSFNENDLVIFGTPVYAGRVPNVLLKFLSTLKGGGSCAVPVVVFGNRNFDDALIELRDILQAHDFTPIAAGAFVGEHSFSTILGAGRPDEKDVSEVKTFANKIVEKISSADKSEDMTDFEVEGVPNPYRGYYQPRDRHGNSINILKVKPLTKDSCTDCKLCAKICPMGSISYENVNEFIGICIKCGGCIKKCPVQAKYYEDEGYLYHQHELEDMYIRRAEPNIFI